MKRMVYFGLIALLVYSCVEPYQPEVGEYESTLVVDGIFTDSEEDTSTVILSRSFGYDEFEPQYIRQATVVIEDDQGNSTILEENTPGHYQTNPVIFPGQAGRNYRLLITTPEGNQFESDWEMMKPAPPVENVYFEYREVPLDDPEAEPLRGIQLFLNSKDPENNTRYYHWDFEETYVYDKDHPPLVGVRFGNPPGSAGDTSFYILPDDFEGYRCWKTEYSTKLLLASTENLTEDAVRGFPIHFVNNRSSRLYRRYSLLVRQYAVSKNYYTYLKKIEEINETTGSLFDPIPNEVFGNIRSSDGDAVPVLGYFGVAGLAKLRTFITREELPLGIGAPFGPVCEQDTIPLNFQTLYEETRRGDKVLYNYQYSLFGDIIGFVLTQPPCAHCYALGATNIEPDFW